MMRWCIGLIVLCLTSLSSAQSTQPTLALTAHLLFPDRLLLEAALPVPASEVAEMRLSIAVPGQPVLQITYPPQPFRFAREFVIADYVYNFSFQDPLPPFTEIQYRWTAALANGQQIIAADSVIYQDTRVRWQTLQSSELATFIYSEGAGASFLSELAETTALLERLQAELGRAPRVQWVFYPPNVPPICDLHSTAAQASAPRHRYFWAGEQRDDPCDLALGQRVFDAYGYRVMANPSPSTWAVLRRGLVEEAYAALWSALPAWLREGLLGLYVPRRIDDVGIVRQALRSRRPLSLRMMEALPPAAASEALWFAQAHTMTRYLLAAFGVERVFRLARSVNDYPDFATAYAAVFDRSLAALLPDWETWIFTESAYLAASYSIYMGVTPTPTPTFTASPTPVLPTAESTPTPPLATPTPRPTRTRTPPTPTPTPLPPEAFVVRATATPAPGGTSAGLLLTGVPIGVFVGAGISGLALAVLAAYAFSRRR
jgi:hypothetical protein